MADVPRSVNKRPLPGLVCCVLDEVVRRAAAVTTQLSKRQETLNLAPRSGRAALLKSFGRRQAYESPGCPNPRAAGGVLWGFRS